MMFCVLVLHCTLLRSGVLLQVCLSKWGMLCIGVRFQVLASYEDTGKTGYRRAL